MDYFVSMNGYFFEMLEVEIKDELIIMVHILSEPKCQSDSSCTDKKLKTSNFFTIKEKYLYSL